MKYNTFGYLIQPQMNFFKKLLGKQETNLTLITSTAVAPDTLPAPSPEEAEDFTSLLDKIMPIMKAGQSGQTTSMAVIVEGEEYAIPEQFQPVTYPVSFDALSIIFGIDKGSHYEWMQNKHAAISTGSFSIDDLLSIAYRNLTEQVKDTLSLHLINEKAGMLTGCDGLESSMILVEGVWETIRKSLHAWDIVFTVPLQDIFLFCDAATPDNIQMLAEKAAELYNDPNYQKKVSPRLYIHTVEGQTLVYEG